MRQKITPILSAIMVILALQLNYAKAQQVVLFHENFDSVLIKGQYPLPTGWHCTKPTTNVLDSLSYGYHIDSTGFSAGTYSNSSAGLYGAGMVDSASGKNHITIKNVEDSTGWYNLYMPSISTLNKTGIQMIWGSRISNSFIADGSAVPQLWFSVDNGATWDSITHQDSPGGSAWGFVNGGVNINFPSKAENKAALMIRFTQHIQYYSGGTYRMDDVWVWGTTSNTGSGINNVVENNSFAIVPNPAADKFTITSNDVKNGKVVITDLIGQTVRAINNCNFPVSVERNNLPNGVYFVQINNQQNQTIAVKKLIIE